MERNKPMSFGRKLTIAFGVMLVATLALGIASVTAIRGLSADFDIAALRTTKKLDLAGLMSTNVERMLSLERGALVLFSLMDKAGAEEYHNRFNATSQLLAGQITEMRPLLFTETGKHDLKVIETGMIAWTGAHRELWQAGKKDHTEAAMSIYAKRELPPASP